jgi:nitroreductase
MNLADFHSLVRQARATRRFVASPPITEADLRAFVDCARVAPSSRNQQVVRFRLVSTAEECARVFPHTKWAGALPEWGGPTPSERATGYIFLCKPVGVQAGHDVGIAAQTIKLAALCAGYASCMLGALDRPALHTVLRLPAELEIDIGIAFGRPGETVQIETAQPGAGLNYWRTPDQVHHVPKLPLDALIVPAPAAAR